MNTVQKHTPPPLPLKPKKKPEIDPKDYKRPPGFITPTFNTRGGNPAGGRGNGSGKGYPRKFENPEQLIDQFARYIEHVQSNPFEEDKAYSTAKGIQHTKLKRQSPITKTGFLCFIGVTAQSWSRWLQERDDLRDTLMMIDAYIGDYKYRGAAAGVFNPGVIFPPNGQPLDTLTGDNPNPQPEPEVPEELIANKVHPDDPQPLNVPRPLYSYAQIEAGIPFVAPPHDSCVEGTLAAPAAATNPEQNKGPDGKQAGQPAMLPANHGEILP